MDNSRKIYSPSHAPPPSRPLLNDPREHAPSQGGQQQIMPSQHNMHVGNQLQSLPTLSGLSGQMNTQAGNSQLQNDQEVLYSQGSQSQNYLQVQTHAHLIHRQQRQHIMQQQQQQQQYEQLQRQQQYQNSVYKHQQLQLQQQYQHSGYQHQAAPGASSGKFGTVNDNQVCPHPFAQQQQHQNTCLQHPPSQLPPGTSSSTAMHNVNVQQPPPVASSVKFGSVNGNQLGHHPFAQQQQHQNTSLQLPPPQLPPGTSSSTTTCNVDVQQPPPHLPNVNFQQAPPIISSSVTVGNSSQQTHQQSQHSQLSSYFIADGVKDPWSEIGWKKKSLQIRVYAVKERVWVALDIAYIGNIFLTSGVQAVKFEGSTTIASMKFETQADAAATMQRFGGGHLPGYLGDLMVQLQWLEPSLLASPVGSSKRKRVSLEQTASKRLANERRDHFVPFLEFVADGDKEVVRRFQFKAICVVSSIKPADCRSSKTVCTPLGTSILFGLFKYAEVEHIEGRTWGGKFSLKDLLVSLCGCSISMCADELFCSANVKLDENRIMDLLEPYYMLDGELPPYWNDLRTAISSAPMDMQTNSESTLEHSEKILSDAALSTTDQLSHLVQDFVNAYDGYHPHVKKWIDASVDANVGCSVDDWRPETNKDRLLELIFRDGHVDSNHNRIFKGRAFENGNSYRYSHSVVSQSVNLRHLLVHTLQRTKVINNSMFEDPVELIFFIHHYYPRFYPRFITYLLKLMKINPLIRNACRSYFER